MEKQKPFMVGICGGSASGKSWLINEIAKQLSEKVTIISQDNYYKPIEQLKKDRNGYINFDLPETIYFDQLLEDLIALKNGKSISKLSYNFNNPKIKREMLEITPKKIILTEGIFIFHQPALFQLFDLKIFLDAEEDVKLKRRIKRDKLERATAKEISNYQWHEHVSPAFVKYILPYKNMADILLQNNEEGKDIVSNLVTLLKTKI